MSLLKAGRPRKPYTSKQEKLLSLLRDDNRIIRFNINMPYEIHKKLKIMAFERNTTIKHLLLEQAYNLIRRIERSESNKTEE